MARTPVHHEQKKELIIQAALKTFANYGYEGTTNKLIAAEAGKLMGQDGKPVSPGLIYHYFPDGKAQLFAACLDQLPELGYLHEIIMANMEQPPEVFLRLVVTNYNEMLKRENVLPILRLAISEGVRQPDLVRSLVNTLGPKLMLPLVQYALASIKSGKVRAKKTDQLGMQIFAPIILRRIVLATLSTDIAPFMADPAFVSSDEEFLESLVQTILQGMLI